MTDGKTHWNGCWREHLECAVARVEEYENATLDAPHDYACPMYAWETAERWTGPKPACDCWKADLPALGEGGGDG